MNEYFSGKKLYGDDFTIQQIQEWFDDEKEAYANLGSKDNADKEYTYDALNNFHGFSKLKKVKTFNNVLGFGSAYGYEFNPIIDRVKKLYILEPSDNLISKKLSGIIPEYKKPNINGHLDFNDIFFDLITSFGVLHHIPNVSAVVKEINRCLKPGGYFLLREPICSMGDWRNPRTGLTKRERGISLPIFKQIIKENNFEIVNEGLCFCMTSFLYRKFGKYFKNPLYTYKNYIVLDNILSKIFKFNLVYHPTSFVQRIAPSSVFYVLRKK